MIQYTKKMNLKQKKKKFACKASWTVALNKHSVMQDSTFPFPFPIPSPSLAIYPPSPLLKLKIKNHFNFLPA